MKPRSTPLPPDLQYCIDGGVEYGHITGGVHAAIMLYASIDELDRVHAIPHPDKRGWDATAAMCTEVEAYGQSLIAQIDDPKMREACLGSTTTSFLRALSDQAEYICGQSYEDAIWGGSMIHRHETRANWRGRIHRRLARRLRTDGFVKRAVRHHHHENGYLHLRHLRGLIPTPLPPATEAGFELLSATLSDQRGRSAERSRQWIIDHTPQIRRENRKARATNRRSVIRAAALASTIVGASAVSAFARGEPVRLEAPSTLRQAQDSGQALVMEVRSGGQIERIGHSGLTVTLKDANDEYLAGLCVYQDLPALDQLASLALHVQSGGIADVIRSGNVYNPSPKAFAHPALVTKAPPVYPLAEVAGTVCFPIDNHSARLALMRNYEDEMGDRFRHRVFIDVLGAREGEQAWATFRGFQAKAPELA